jgi:hypothetical protein
MNGNRPWRCISLVLLVGGSWIALFAPRAALAQTEGCSGSQHGTIEFKDVSEGVASTTNLKLSSGDQNVILVFQVSGCSMTSATSADGITAQPTSRDIAVSDLPSLFGPAIAQAKGQLLVVTIPVSDPKAFPAGEHTVIFGITGPQITPAAETITIDHRYDGIWVWVIFLGSVLAGVVACGVAIYAGGTGKLELHPIYIVIGVVVAAGAAFTVFTQTYLDADAWIISAKSAVALFIACATAAAGGATTGAITKAVVRKAKAATTSSAQAEAPRAAPPGG